MSPHPSQDAMARRLSVKHGNFSRISKLTPLLEPSEDQNDKAFKLLQTRPNALRPRSADFKKTK